LALTALAVVSSAAIGTALAQNAPATARSSAGRTLTPPVNGGATVAYATTSFNCTNRNGWITTYTLSVNGGSCTTGGRTPYSAPSAGSCRGSSGDTATANCGTGCGTTTGDGSCTQTSTPPR
jgi:hypothetical protein